MTSNPDSDTQFISQFQNWRTNRSRTATPANPAGESIQDRARGFFSSLEDSLSQGYDELYTRLPMVNQDLDAQPEPSWFKLSRVERLISFFCLLLGSIACFALGILLFPVLTLKPRKFALLWTLGSVLFVLSFGALQGPMDYCKHLISRERLPFTVVYFGSIFSTLYCALILKSTILTLITGFVEIFAVLYYTLSYFPFGAQGFSMVMSLGIRQFSSLIGM